MDSVELSKIAGAVLCALLLIVSTNTLISMNMNRHADVAGYTLEVDEEAAKPAPSANPGASPAATPAATPTATATPAPTATSASGFDPAAIVAQVAAADATKGKKVFKKCGGCHHSQAGKGAKSGPNLWGIVDRPKAGVEGFGYSGAMSAKGGSWTLEDLASFLHKPKDFIPKSAMTFRGVKKDADLVKLLAYLKSLN